MLNHILFCQITIFVGRSVGGYKIDTGFNGSTREEAYTKFKTDFINTINR